MSQVKKTESAEIVDLTVSIAQEDKQTIIVNGYAYPTISDTVLRNWIPHLTFVSTFCYGVTADGHLIDLDDEAILKIIGPTGTEALMVIAPMDEAGSFNSDMAAQLLSDRGQWMGLIEEILETIKIKGLFGVDFDFEFIPAEYSDAYAELVKETREILNDEGYIVTVALAPKTSAEQQGLLYQGHDYRLLGEAANFCLLMTYEWGYTYSEPMAVAPINNVRRVIEYGLTEIQADKILMGIPNYGYDWTLPYVEGQSRAQKLSANEAMTIAEQYGAEILYDETAQTPYFDYTDREGREHQVWFENYSSLYQKLLLVGEYGLAGVSFWNIMNYYEGTGVALNSLYNVAKV